MHREKMDGVNLREGIMEVALEQWTEHILVVSRIQRFPRYREAVSDETNDQERAGQVDSRTGRVQKRKFLNLGGNTDDIFALSIRCSGFFL